MTAFVKFERNDPQPTETGGEVDQYSELLTTRGYLRTRSGNRSLADGELLLYSSHELTCRFQQALENELSKDVRILINNAFYTISAWALTDEKRFYYTFQINQAKR